MIVGPPRGYRKVVARCSCSAHEMARILSSHRAAIARRLHDDRAAAIRFGILAHLSCRLTGELIGYPWIRRPSVRRPSVVRPFTFSNIFSSETAWPIKAKFYVEPPWKGGTKVYTNGPGHMTKMAAMPIYGKNPSKIFFSRTGRPIFTYVASGTPAHHSLYK